MSYTSKIEELTLKFNEDLTAILLEQIAEATRKIAKRTQTQGSILTNCYNYANPDLAYRAFIKDLSRINLDGHIAEVLEILVKTSILTYKSSEPLKNAIINLVRKNKPTSNDIVTCIVMDYLI